jgi:hypothetical protein
MHQRAAEWRERHMTVGPSEAFALFFKNTSAPVFRALLAGTLNRVAAEDATAEAFARAFAHWDTVAVHPNPEGVGAAGRLELLPVLVAAVGGTLVGGPA